MTTVDAAHIGLQTVNTVKHVDVKLDLAHTGTAQAAQSELYYANGHKTSALQESVAKAYSNNATPAVSKVQAST